MYPPEIRNPSPEEPRIPLHIVLYAPRIPHNSGQIARSCLAMGCRLHLVRPLGFRLDAAALRRSAVGHLAEVDLQVHADGDALWRVAPDPTHVWLVSKYGQINYTDVNFQEGDWLIFGNETEGLPSDWLQRHADRTLCIPMVNPQARCLNLATAVTAVMFEALRQIGLTKGGKSEIRNPKSETKNGPDVPSSPKPV